MVAMTLIAFMTSGTIAGWLTVVALAAAGWAVWRGGGLTALATLRTANEILEVRVQDLERLRLEDQQEIALLRARTDVTLALAPLAAELAGHELAAEARNQKLLSVLNLIADRLGPDE
jgi:hypothetical protein